MPLHRTTRILEQINAELDRQQQLKQARQVAKPQHNPHHHPDAKIIPEDSTLPTLIYVCQFLMQRMRLALDTLGESTVHKGYKGHTRRLAYPAVYFEATSFEDAEDKLKQANSLIGREAEFRGDAINILEQQGFKMYDNFMNTVIEKYHRPISRKSKSAKGKHSQLKIAIQREERSDSGRKHTAAEKMDKLMGREDKTIPACTLPIRTHAHADKRNTHTIGGILPAKKSQEKVSTVKKSTVLQELTEVMEALDSTDPRRYDASTFDWFSTPPHNYRHDLQLKHSSGLSLQTCRSILVDIREYLFENPQDSDVQLKRYETEVFMSQTWSNPFDCPLQLAQG